MTQRSAREQHTETEKWGEEFVSTALRVWQISATDKHKRSTEVTPLSWTRGLISRDGGTVGGNIKHTRVYFNKK